MHIVAGMVSCRQRDAVRALSLDSFARSDWGAAPTVVMDESQQSVIWRRIEETFLRLLRALDAGDGDFFLLLEDDIEVHPRLRHNLERWLALMGVERDLPFLGSLYRCCQPVIWSDPRRRLLVAAPEAFWGAQALVVSRATARHALARWNLGAQAHDTQLPLLAAQLGPVYYHAPSLVQHRPVPSTWGNGQHHAPDYSPDFVAP